MRSPLPIDHERGTVTAEFAVVLPAVLLCLALCLAAVQAGGQQLRLIDAAATAARLLARGDPAGDSSGLAGVQLASERSGGLVCVTLSTAAEGGMLSSLGLTIRARSCALDESVPEAAS